MIIAQVCLRLVTIKGHGPKTNQYPVWPPFASCSATHLLHIELIRLLWPVGCWSTPLQWLWEVAGYWQELEHAVVYADPEHPKHTQCVTCPVSMLAMQEPRCFQLPGIVYRSLQHGAVHYHAATWGHGREWRRKNWPQDLVTVSLCIQNAINNANNAINHYRDIRASSKVQKIWPRIDCSRHVQAVGVVITRISHSYQPYGNMFYFCMYFCIIICILHIASGIEFLFKITGKIFVKMHYFNSWLIQWLNIVI